MKIKAINPGYVWKKDNGRGMVQGFGYCFIVTTAFGIKITVDSLETFPSASEAKQAMREKVHHERIRNGLINSGTITQTKPRNKYAHQNRG